MTDAYRVTSPYVTLKVRDQNTGSWTTLGFHVNALLPDTANIDDLARLLRKGMIEKVAVAKPAEEPRVEPKATGTKSKDA